MPLILQSLPSACHTSAIFVFSSSHCPCVISQQQFFSFPENGKRSTLHVYYAQREPVAFLQNTYNLAFGSIIAAILTNNICCTFQDILTLCNVLQCPLLFYHLLLFKHCIFRQLPHESKDNTHLPHLGMGQQHTGFTPKWRMAEPI